jgi:hypothetical protein
LTGREEIIEKKKKELSACRGEGSVVGPLLAVLRCRCVALYRTTLHCLS